MKPKMTVLIILTILFSGCEKYLDQAPESIIKEKDVFTNYNTFQAFSDRAISNVFDPLYCTSPLCGTVFPDGDNSHSGDIHSLTYWAIVGDYRRLMTGTITGDATSTTFYSFGSKYEQTFWGSSWYGIRNTNMALSKISLFENSKSATEEQLNLIKGSNYFLRGFFHYRLMSLWGGLPYIDKLILPDDELRIPRPPLKVGMQKCVDDFVKSADLLPKDWDETDIGKENPGINRGRATKGSAYGMVAKVLLFMGSPLNSSDYQYDIELCKKSAMYGWEVIELAQAGYHQLMPVGEINSKTNIGTLKSCFAIKSSGDSFYNKENLFIVKPSSSIPYFNNAFMPQKMGGSKYVTSPTQNLVDKFETVNGWMIEDDPTYNPKRPWIKREPRFYENIATDSTKVGVGNAANDFCYLLTYSDDGKGSPGKDYGVGQTETGYYIRKFWMFDNVPGGENEIKTKSNVATPILRLAEVYLNYAEALVAAGYTPYQKPTFSNGKQGISALEAINLLRSRKVASSGKPILPPLDAARMAKYGAPGTDGTVKGSFMEHIWNERAVELCFEMSRWIDLRRWHVAHLPQYRELKGCQFNKNRSNFSYPTIANIFFEERNYWMPLPSQQLNIFNGYDQNPGW